MNKPCLLVAGGLAFSYFALLSAKTFTWAFASGDSGDWLTASTIWSVPQPIGSPLYVSLGHLLNLLPGGLPIKMTLFLSALPAGITIVLVWLAVNRITNNYRAGAVAGLVLAASAVSLTQAVVVEEYSLATMFLVLGFYFCIRGNGKLAALALGLGTAVHVVVGAVAVLWLVLYMGRAANGFRLRNMRSWIPVVTVFVASGIIPYSLTLWEMATDTTPFIAGNGLSLTALSEYLGSVSVVGSISLHDTPGRLLTLVCIIVGSMGLALVPAAVGVSGHWRERWGRMAITGAAFPIWYYATSMDPTTWTYLVFGTPFIAVLAGVGVAGMLSGQTKVRWAKARMWTNTGAWVKTLVKAVVPATVACSVALLVSNAVLFDADEITKKNPVAEEYYRATMELPEGSLVVMHRGGWESMAAWYAMTTRKDLLPLFPGDETDELYKNYIRWMNDKGVDGRNESELVIDAVAKGRKLFVVKSAMPVMDIKPLEDYNKVFWRVAR